MPKDPNNELPEFGKDAFKCPHCAVWAHQEWRGAYGQTSRGGIAGIDHFHFSRCLRCEGHCFWTFQKLVYPSTSTAPMPSPDMPHDVRLDYLEARDVFEKSARAAGGLLRIGFEKLFPHLGVDKSSPNDAIGELVKKGLALGSQQQAMDVVRIFSNQAVHNGFVKLEDQPATVAFLFRLMNYIVEQLITRPKEIASLYATLPPDKIAGIEKRDGKK